MSERKTAELRAIPHRRPLRTLVAWLAGVYTLLLVIYLLLRLLAGDQWWWLALLHNFTPYAFVPALLLLPLALLVRAWGSAARLLPVLALGAAWFAPLWVPDILAAPRALPRAWFGAAQVGREPDELTVLTFNALPANQRLPEVAAWIRQSGADVVLLQEVTPENKPLLVTALAGTYAYHDDALGNQLTLSRFPLVDAQTIDLGDWYSRRLVINFGGREVAVYNIHLAMPVRTAARFELPVSGLLALALQYDETTRNEQMRVLMDILDTETLPLIAAGDFNTSDGSLIYGELALRLGDAYRTAGWGYGATYPAGVGEEGLPAFLPTLLRVDYVWYSSAWQPLVAVTGPALGSDHLPLLARLRLTR